MNQLLGQAPPAVFAAYTDPARAQALLQAYANAVFGRECGLTHCSVLHSAYRSFLRPASWAKSTLSVCYRVDLQGEDDVILYAKIFLENQSRTAWASLTPMRDTMPEAAPRHVPALDMIVWRFPFDPTMPQMATLLTAEAVRPHLPYVELPPGLRGPEEVAHLSVQRVGYVPEHACTVRYQLTAQATAASQVLTLYGKTYRDGRAREVCRFHEHLWRSEGAGALKMAQPLGYDETLNVFWQLGIAGRALGEVIDASNYEHYLKQVGHGLTLMHGSDVHSAVTESATALGDECLKKIAKLLAALPACARQLDVLRARVERTSAPSPARLIHGDFHVGQLLADGGSVYFLDFDSFAMGEPEQDLAEFIVSLLFAPFGPDLVRSMATALLAAYATHAPWAIRFERLHWHASVQYVTRAHRCYRELRPGWAAALRHCLEELSLDDVLPAALT